jgi:hypothetical protein
MYLNCLDLRQFHPAPALCQLYGGAFRRLLPSNLRAAGAHARNCVPVFAGNQANDSQKGLLISIFQRDGCHHCGEASLTGLVQRLEVP